MQLKKLLRILVEKDISSSTVSMLTKPMSLMNMEQKEERAGELVKIIESSETEEEIIAKAEELGLIRKRKKKSRISFCRWFRGTNRKRKLSKQ